MKLVEEGRQEEFHRRYEDSVLIVKKILGKTYLNYIGGTWVEASGGGFQVTSPINTEMVVGYFQKSSVKEARDAISTAKAAFASWGRTPWQERVRIVRAVADKISQRKFEFASTISIENGKNRFEAIGEVDEAIDAIRFYCYEMESNNGYEVKMGQAYPNESSTSILKPYGVWGVICPFNFPLAIPVGMCIGALITGNTVVFKPSSDTPLTMYRFTEVLHEMELPPGVFNYITGNGPEVGAEIISNDDISGIAFTGSKVVGHTIARGAVTRRPRPVITEMGGKNPIIVTSKADLDKAVEGVVRSAFGYGGQKCSACSRVLVLEEIKNEFLKRLVDKTKSLRIGDPTERDVILGPIINGSAHEKYRKFVELAKNDGLVLTGGRVLAEGKYAKGLYVEPTIVEGLPEDHPLMQEELFVPIVCVKAAKNLVEAMDMANGIEYGLAAGIFSEDSNEVKYFFDNIQAGVTYANRRIGGTTGAMIGAQPFGGWKSSGSTGKGVGGKYYLPQFMREQSQTIAS